MICQTCQSANRPEARFCKRCGYWLAPQCPFCSAGLPPAALFCDQCGRQINFVSAAGAPAAPGAPRAPETAQPAARETPAPEAQPAPPARPPQPAASPLHQYIPQELLSKLEAARASGGMIGERRIVTMLFCDVQGSTAAAQQLDPEEWSEIMNGAFEHMIRPVYAYEGTVARLMGDSILAFFGAPIAHEDDPQRAVLAGLDIVAGSAQYRTEVRQRWGIAFNVRVGINTGLVVVGAVGSDLRLEYSAQGDAVNLAARMEQTAQPGTVQVAHDTYKLVKPMFDWEDLGGIEVKGKSEPVPAYRALARRAAAARVRGIEGLHAEMVGREAELEMLRSVLRDLRQGVGRIVCVLGEAGLGKSRLVSEAAKGFADLAGPLGQWHETSSLSYESGQAYGLFQRLIRAVTGMAYNEPAAALEAKLAGLVQTLPEAARPRAARIFDALFGAGGENNGLPLEGEAFIAELREAMRDWWRAQFADRPTVLVFDDMHWTDAASIELLRQLLPLAGEISLVLVCVLRSDRQAPAWRLRTTADEEHGHRFTEITLRPLSEAESNELVDRLLAIAELPAGLRAGILEKSAGNPFFIEEVVRTLIDNGALVPEDRLVDGRQQRFWCAAVDRADFVIPDNLQALLAARLDRLEETTRSTLQVAAVIGRSFHHRVLQAVDEDSPALERDLGTLLRLDLIREAARVPEVEYAFRNPLTQEAVYNTILLKRRREFHRRVGAALEMLYPERIEGLAGLLAYHFAQAGERERAIHYFRQAAQQAVAVHGYADAAQNLRAALDLIEPEAQGETRRTLVEELGDVCRLLRDGAQAIAEYQRALDQPEPPAGPLAALRLQRKIVEVVADLKWSVSLEDLQQAGARGRAARAALEAGLERLAAEPPQPEAARALIALSTYAWRIQEPPDWEAAQRFAQAAVDLTEGLDNPVDLSRGLGALANVLDGRSRLREYLAIAQKRLSLCRATGFADVRERIEALRSAGAAFMYVGEYEEALPFLQEAEAVAGSAQVVEQQANAIGLQAQCWFRLDRWDAVFATEERWRDLESRYPRERIGETCFFVALSASVHALRGDAERASAYGKESYDYMVSMSGLPDAWQRNQFY